MPCKALSLLVLLILAFVLTAPECAYACTCLPIPPVPQAVEQSTAVFAARVTELIPSDAPGGPTLVKFEVSRVWKGPVLPLLQATTAPYDEICGYEFEEDVEYLVYAVGEPNALEVYLCSRTRPLSLAGSDLAMLGPGVEPGRLYLPYIMVELGQDQTYPRRYT